MSANVASELELCCRFLEDNEYYKLVDIFAEHEDEMPDPKLSRIAVVEIKETEEIIGFFCFQLYGHTEPLWVAPAYRKEGITIKLIEMLLPLTERGKTFMIATTPEVVHLCEKLGLRKIKHPVYVKDVV